MIEKYHSLDNLNRDTYGSPRSNVADCVLGLQFVDPASNECKRKDMLGVSETLFS